MKRHLWLGGITSLIVFLFLAACSSTPGNTTQASSLSLTLLHVNDTHSKLESALGEVKIDIDAANTGKRTFLELGGFSRLWAAVEELRSANANSLFVHAGDIFQGTLYFTQFLGAADGEFLNAMGLDAVVVGNHEFDKGPQTLGDFAGLAKFPLLGCNLDLSAEASLKGKIKPWVIKEIQGQKVALVGIANPDTPYISSPGKNVKFLDPVASLKAAARTWKPRASTKSLS